MEIKHCKKCLMPNTKPGSIFNEGCVCQACINYEARKSVNWQERRKKLDEICEKHRSRDGYYDCIIAVSGGKDSHFLVYVMKVIMKMNPLLITVGDPFSKTTTGLKNFRNLGETFNCDHFLFNISIDLFRRVTKIAFEEFGDPLRFVEAAIKLVPIKMAVKFGIPLLVYGEDSAYEYGCTRKETYSVMESMRKSLNYVNIDFWLKKGITPQELNAITPPKEKELLEANIYPIFMGYFFPWSSTNHLSIAKRYGFSDLSHEWKREGYIEDFEQIDSVAYLVHLWLKYPKFGFQRTSDIVSRRVREGLLSLPEAKKLIKENDHKIDQRALDDFNQFLGYTPKQFWDIVDKFWNPDLFENINIDGVYKRKFNYDL